MQSRCRELCNGQKGQYNFMYMNNEAFCRTCSKCFDRDMLHNLFCPCCGTKMRVSSHMPHSRQHNRKEDKIKRI